MQNKKKLCFMYLAAKKFSSFFLEINECQIKFKDQFCIPEYYIRVLYYIGTAGTEDNENKMKQLC